MSVSIATRTPHRSESLMALGLATGPVVALGFTRFAYALLLPSMRSDLNWTFAAAGGVNSANAAGYILGSASAAWCARRFGARAVFVFSLAASAALLVVAGASGNYAVIASLRFLGGLSTAVTFVIGSALASRIHTGSQHHRSAVLVGLYMAGVGAGVVLSGLVVPIITSTLSQSTGWRLAWAVLGVLAIVAVAPAAWAARRIAPPPAPSADRQDPLNFARLAPTVVWYVLFGAGYVSYMTFVVALLHANGVSSLGQAAFFITLGLASIIATLTVWGRLLGRLRGGHAPALISVLVLVGVLPVLVSHSLAAALVSAVVFGSSFMAGPTAVTVLARRTLPAHGWTTGIAYLTVAFSVGQAIGPFVAGMLSDSSGGITEGLWLAVALLAFAGVVALAQREPDLRGAISLLPDRADSSAPPVRAVPFRRILLAVDGTARDRPAEQMAVAIARSLDAHLDVIHVESESVAWDTSSDLADTDSDVLAATVDRLTAAGVRAVGHLVHAPDVDAADAIAEAAARVGADLVIAAPHHRSHLHRWLEPSVSEQLAQRSPAAVLLVA